MDNVLSTVWDPLGEPVDNTTFLANQIELVEKVQKLRNDSNLPKKYLLGLFLIPVVVFALLIFAHASEGLPIIISFVPLILYYKYLTNLQKQLILYLLCEQNHWIYNPKEDDERTEKMKVTYPAVFAKGRYQRISDQIWGSAAKNKKVDFWRCTFIYVTGTGRSAHTHVNPTFIIRLNKKLPVTFSLVKPGLLSRFREDIDTESEEFNHLFKINASEAASSKAEIMKILSPSVQVRLINFVKEFAVECIHFQDNTMVLVFSSEVWKPKYTSFLKKFAVDERDVSNFLRDLSSMISLPSEMVEFMD